MNERNQENREVERLLETMRLAEPSAGLRTRVTDAAREAWHEAEVEAPWRIGLRRLGVSAAAAVLIGSCANYFSDLSVAKWQPGQPATTVMEQANDEEMPGSPYSPFLRHVAAARRAAQPDPAALLEHMQELRRMPGFADTELQ
jgi:hypothetical protein